MSSINLQIDRDQKKTTMWRVFDAPRELVFKAHTDPEMVSKWWGPRGVATNVATLEPKKGGKWRFVQKDNNGQETGFSGEYLDVVPNEKITWTFGWDGMPGHYITETMEFIDEGGKTKLMTTSIYNTLEDLEGMLQYGMEAGATETWDRLAELVTNL